VANNHSDAWRRAAAAAAITLSALSLCGRPNLLSRVILSAVWYLLSAVCCLAVTSICNLAAEHCLLS
jgi:hypothetical protein